MHEAMVRYFHAEKVEGYVFFAAGVVALAAAVLLWRYASTWRGMAIPLAAVGLIQAGVGVVLYVRTDKQVAGLARQLDDDPAAYKAEEGKRMRGVMRSFAAIKIAELALFAAAVGVTFAFRRREMLFAAAVGLILQAGVMLVFDLVAEQRAEVYLGEIERTGG